MSLRWRIGGELLCAAKSDEKKDDTYINDRLHHLLYELEVIIPDDDEDATGKWVWVDNAFIRNVARMVKDYNMEAR